MWSYEGQEKSEDFEEEILLPDFPQVYCKVTAIKTVRY